jgi:hypothetical protein
MSPTLRLVPGAQKSPSQSAMSCVSFFLLTADHHVTCQKATSVDRAYVLLSKMKICNGAGKPSKLRFLRTCCRGLSKLAPRLRTNLAACAVAVRKCHAPIPLRQFRWNLVHTCFSSVQQSGATWHALCTCTSLGALKAQYLTQTIGRPGPTFVPYPRACFST